MYNAIKNMPIDVSNPMNTEAILTQFNQSCVEWGKINSEYNAAAAKAEEAGRVFGEYLQNPIHATEGQKPKSLNERSVNTKQLEDEIKQLEEKLLKRSQICQGLEKEIAKYAEQKPNASNDNAKQLAAQVANMEREHSLIDHELVRLGAISESLTSRISESTHRLERLNSILKNGDVGNVTSSLLGDDADAKKLLGDLIWRNKHHNNDSVLKFNLVIEDLLQYKSLCEEKLNAILAKNQAPNQANAGQAQVPQQPVNQQQTWSGYLGSFIWNK